MLYLENVISQKHVLFAKHKVWAELVFIYTSLVRKSIVLAHGFLSEISLNSMEII